MTLSGIVVVTGTGTGVGKTVVTAAMAALAHEAGRRVAVVKPGQTGVAVDEPGDADDVRRLTGIGDVQELVRYPDPLAPATAARLAGLPPLDLEATAARLAMLAAHRDLVLVEGAGGLLVRYDERGRGMAELAAALDAPMVVVADPRLGTLNHTALTLEAMAHRGLELADVVLGSWPEAPDLAARSNLADLQDLAGRPLGGALAAGAGSAAPAGFLALARAGLSPAWGGSFDAADFTRRHSPLGSAPSRPDGSRTS